MTENEHLIFIRLFVDHLETLQFLDDAATGRAVKDILRYAQTNGTDESIEAAITEKDEKIAFSLFKMGYTESVRAHANRAEAGRKGGLKTQEANRENAEKAQPYLEKYGAPEEQPADVGRWKKKTKQA